MSWVDSLLWDPASVAHIVFLYAFVISVGVLLGKIKFFGISLGVTFVLFTGILMGHFGFTAETHILHFLREFGLILFVFCIGLQVGPSFFSSFKKGGMRLNALAVAIVLLNIVVALGIYFLAEGRVSLPMMVGIMYGAVTNTPGLGAAQEALNQLHYTGDPIALGYACAYPLGVVGIIGSVIAIRYIFRVNFQKEEQDLQTLDSSDLKHKPHMMSLEVRNESINGKTLLQVKDFLARAFVCSRIRHEGHVSIPDQNTLFYVGDQLFIVCSEEDAAAITAFIGKEIEVDWERQDMPMVSRRILVTKSEINGKKLGSMHFRSMFGVNVTRINRSGMDLFADPNLVLQVGDRVMVVGQQDAVDVGRHDADGQLREAPGPSQLDCHLRRYPGGYHLRKYSVRFPGSADPREAGPGGRAAGGGHTDRALRAQAEAGDLHHDERQPDAEGDWHRALPLQRGHRGGRAFRGHGGGGRRAALRPLGLPHHGGAPAVGGHLRPLALQAELLHADGPRSRLDHRPPRAGLCQPGVGQRRAERGILHGVSAHHVPPHPGRADAAADDDVDSVMKNLFNEE